jgi:hypothetical protein
MLCRILEKTRTADGETFNRDNGEVPWPPSPSERQLWRPNQCAYCFMTNCLFEEPWWLDAVAPGEWNAVKIERGGQVVARLPYVRRRRYGLTLITQPPLTQTLGPWVRAGEGKYSSQLSDQHDLMSQLVAQAPTGDIFAQTLSPLVMNFLPFHWQNFKTSIRCTYRIESMVDQDAIWADLTEKCRNTIRKAKKVVVVRDDLGVQQFYEVVAQTWARQNLRPPFSCELLSRLHAACVARNSGRIFHAVDSEGRIHAAIFMVWDHRTAYYLVGGGNPGLRNSGAHSLLIWEAIRFTSTLSKVFDFEGSMNPAIEHFCRSFGAKQTPLVHVRKISRRMAALSALKELLEVLTGKHFRWFF